MWKFCLQFLHQLRPIIAAVAATAIGYFYLHC
jgi:hypothetical protein